MENFIARLVNSPKSRTILCSLAIAMLTALFAYLDDNLLKWQPSLSVAAYQVLAVVSVVGNAALRFLTTTDLAEKKGIGK